MIKDNMDKIYLDALFENPRIAEVAYDVDFSKIRNLEL